MKRMKPFIVGSLLILAGAAHAQTTQTTAPGSDDAAGDAASPAPAGGRGVTADEPGALTRVPQGGRGEVGPDSDIDVDGGSAGGATSGSDATGSGNSSSDPETAPRTERPSERPLPAQGAAPSAGAGTSSKSEREDSAEPESPLREQRRSEETPAATQ